MKTLLIPFDFTETAQNALIYAEGLSKQFDYERIVLLKSFYDTVFDDIVLSGEYFAVEQYYRTEEHEEAAKKLSQIEADFKKRNPAVEIVSAMSEMPILRAITTAVGEFQPRAMLIGSDTDKHDNDSIVSAHVIQIARISPIPVLIVPAGQYFHIIADALIPLDEFTKGSLEKISRLTENRFLQDMHFNILSMKSAVNDSQIESVSSVVDQLSNMGNVKFEFFFSESRDLIEGISHFMDEHTTDLLIALPGKYSFLYKLTHKTLQQAVSKNTNKPVLIVK